MLMNLSPLRLVRVLKPSRERNPVRRSSESVVNESKLMTPIIGDGNNTQGFTDDE